MDVRADLEALLQLPIVERRFPLPKSRKYSVAINYLRAHLKLPATVPSASEADQSSALAPALSHDAHIVWGTLFGWTFVRSLGQVLDAEDFAVQSTAWIDEWFLGRIIASTLREFGLDESAAWRAVATIKALTAQQDWFAAGVTPRKRVAVALEHLLSDPGTREFLGVNRYNEIDWFNKEAFDELLGWLLVAEAIEVSRTGVDVPESIIAAYDVIKQLQDAESVSDYQVEKLRTAVMPVAKAKASRTKDTA
jgi:hypothetical protein